MDGAVLFAMAMGWLMFAALGCWVAGQKNRSPEEGFFLGLCFGPFGVLIEALLPTQEAKPIQPSPAAEKIKAKMTEQGRAVQEIQESIEQKLERSLRLKRLDDERLARAIEEDRQAEIRRLRIEAKTREDQSRRLELAQARAAFIFKFGWFKSLPDTLQPILIGLVVAGPIVAALIFFMGHL